MIDPVALWEEIKSNAGERLPLGTCALVHSIVEAVNAELQVYTQPIVTMKTIPPERAAQITKALHDFNGSPSQPIVLRDSDERASEVSRELCKRLDAAIHEREHYKELMEWLVEQRRALCRLIAGLRRESAELHAAIGLAPNPHLTREQRATGALKVVARLVHESETLNNCLELSVIAETECVQLRTREDQLRASRDEWTRMYDQLLEAIAAPAWSDEPAHDAAIRHCKAQRERLDSIENRLSHARDCLSNAEGYISSSANLAAGGVE